VDAKGKVRDPQIAISSGDRDADNSALQAVQNWRFKPAKCGKQPIDVHIDVQINLSLQ
jgi:TonB family protein